MTICDLTVLQVQDPGARVAVMTQIKFLNLVANSLPNEFIGLRLAQNLGLRELGLFYYVLASSETLGEALTRVARYSAIDDEGVHITCHECKTIRMTFKYVGKAPIGDYHQIEFFIAALLRISRQLTGRHCLQAALN